MFLLLDSVLYQKTQVTGHFTPHPMLKLMFSLRQTFVGCNKSIFDSNQTTDTWPIHCLNT